MAHSCGFGFNGSYSYASSSVVHLCISEGCDELRSWLPLTSIVVSCLGSSELRFRALTHLSVCEINSEIVKQGKVNTLPFGVSRQFRGAESVRS
jgi:hypothetical protein